MSIPRLAIGSVVAAAGICVLGVAFWLHGRHRQTGAARHKHKLLYGGLALFVIGQLIAQ